MKQLYVVNQPFTHLRRTPSEFIPLGFHDRNQESQLIYNETVRVVSKRGEWAFIDAVEQPVFLKNKWIPYQGWVKYKHLSLMENNLENTRTVYDPQARLLNGEVIPFGSQVCSRRKISDKYFNPKSMIHIGLSCVGWPYLWGGRSSYNGRGDSGCDCSGLVDLLFRTQGISIPRNACDQYLASKKIPLIMVKPGDLLFLAPKTPKGKINHVMLYLGDGKALEATEISMSIRVCSIKKRISTSEQLFCGSFL